MRRRTRCRIFCSARHQIRHHYRDAIQYKSVNLVKVVEVAAIVCFGWILSVCFHEFGHAIVAYWGGDRSVKDKGYLTFNIFKYTDPGMTLFFPVFILILGGIALPGAAVYIDNSRLRSRLWQSAVSAAGPVASALVGVLIAMPFLFHFFPPAVPDIVWPALAYLVLLQVYAFILNGLPIPPFDGYGVIEPWLPAQVQERVANFGRYAIWVVFLVLWTVPPVNNALWTVAYSIAKFLGVPTRLSAVGYGLFRENAGWLVVALIAFLFLMRKKGKTGKSEVEWFKEAQQRVAKSEPLDAVSALNEALTINPRFAEAWHLRGICFGLMNRNAEAMENFNQAITINPSYADCWYNKACCNAIQGNADQALSDLQHAIQLSPDTLKAHAKQDVGFRALWHDERFIRIVDKAPH